MLPEGLKVELLPPVERYKLEAFYQRFIVERYREYGDGHFLLACYAAIPVVLTPDLLHRLWLNFSTYQDRGATREIQRVAVSDLLLSSLCDEISYEIYEMSQAIRNVLLDYWQNAARGENDAQVPQIEQVANFLLQYINVYKTENRKTEQDFRDAQEWMAMSYLQPQKAATMMQSAMKNATQNMNAAPQDRMASAEMMRLVEISRRAGERYHLELLAPNQQAPATLVNLTESAEQLKKVLAGRVESLKMDDLARFMSDSMAENAVTMEIPAPIMAKMPTLTQKAEQPRLYALFIGDFRASATENSIIVFKNKVRSEIKGLNHFEKINVRVVQTTDLQTVIAALYEQTTIFDHVFIYKEPEIGYNEFSITQYLAERYNEKNNTLPFSTVFTSGEITPAEKIVSEKLVFITGVFLDKIEKKTPFFFDTLEKSKGRLSLQKLIAIHSQHEVEAQRLDFNDFSPGSTVPYLFAAPSAAHRPLFATANETLDIQYALRNLGFYQGNTNGIYNQGTDDAVSRFFLAQKQAIPTEKNVVINILAQAEKEKKDSDRPLYIFVFANPEQRLPFTVQERAALEGILRETIEANNAEAFFLHDPDKQEVMEYFTKPEYRNRLQIFHFSGFDADPSGKNKTNGLFLKEGEIIGFQDLNDWLDFQENIQLLFLNCCRLKGLAHSLTLRGVAAIIAAEDVILDDFAFDFAKKIYANLAKGKSIEAAFAEAKGGQMQQQQQQSYSNIGDSNDYNQSYATSENKQNDFELLQNWGKRPSTAAWHLKSTEAATQQNATIPVNHLFVISINDYPNQPLRNIQAHMPTLVKTLQSRYYFEAKHTIELYDDSATNRAITETFAQLSKTLTAQDKLCVVYSGNSLVQENDVAWMPFDATPDDDFLYISYAQIKQLMATFTCKNIALIADTPYFDSSILVKQVKTTGSQSCSALFSGQAANATLQANPFFEQILLQLEEAEKSFSIKDMNDGFYDIENTWSGSLLGQDFVPFEFDLRPKFPYTEVANLLQNNNLDEAIGTIRHYFTFVKSFEQAAHLDYLDIVANLQTQDPFSNSENQTATREDVRNRLLDFIDEFYAPVRRKTTK